MTNIQTLPNTGKDAEIHVLIESMHKAALRLEELTEGEIDSIAGPDGRMFLLQHAQHQLRMNEAFRQAAILNALPACIALIDAQGLIISVNKGWRQFANTNMYIDQKNGIGTNYLEICDRAMGNNASEAPEAAEGIRSVLEGSKQSFMMEYVCHSPTEQHWFLMTVTPLANNNLGGAVVMHVNITLRKQAEMGLRHLALAMDGTTDAIYLIDRATMKYVHVNDAACHMHNMKRDQLIAMSPWEVNLIDRAELESIYDELINSGQPANPVEFMRKRSDGSQIWVELRQQAELSEERWKIITVERDITERQEAGVRLHHMAHYDVLTGLPNRKLFYDALTKALIFSAAGKHMISVLFIDLDHFKIVNDTLGHAIGDELLVQFSNRLVQCVRIRDTVGRLGGDEFAIILVMEVEGNSPTVVANKIRETLRKPFDLKGHEMTVTASIGITIYPDDASDTETLIKYADTAMYGAKHAGRDTFRFFTTEMNIAMLAKLELENALQKALENDEFVLYYQPKVDTKTGKVASLEALIRWERPGKGLVSPAEFIPLLEEIGLIVAVGSWVINKVCKQISIWIGSAIGPMQVSVNVSSRQFIDCDLHGDIVKALKENNVPANLLELELTESILMVNTNQTIETLKDLKLQGVAISIDDFGTGYSSLAYLRRFPIDKLKIDIAFIRNIINDPDDASIVLAIISIAHSLKLEVVAEGVETIEQLDYLKKHGCNQIQGYYFSRPLPQLELEKFLLDVKPFAYIAP